MSLQLSLVTDDADFHEFVPFMFEAIHPNGFVDACWPRNLSADAQAIHTAGFIAHKGFDPTVQWVKVTDKSTGEIVGVAQWLIIDNQKPPELDFDGPPGTWKDEQERLHAQEIYRSVVRFRRDLVRNEELPIIILSIMTVHPKHQYRGAGSMMMKWGVDVADKINGLSVVEATAAGRWLYEKSGFETKCHYPVQSTLQEPNGEVVERLFFMVRPRQKAMEPVSV